jgi:acetyl esterase
MNADVDRDMAPILDAMRAAPPLDYASMPIAEARAAFDRNAAPWRALAPEIALIDDLTVRGATGKLRARLYRPSTGPLPLVVFVHGGGWTFGSVDSHENEMRYLALASGAAVLGFDYRLAPEHSFPAPLDDVLAAIRDVRSGCLGARADHSRLALAGDSAGATLALAALLALRNAGEPNACAAALYYGCFAPRFDTESHRVMGSGSFGLSSERMRWYWSNFLAGKLDGAPDLAAPLTAHLRGLPPLYLVAAGLDCLHDDTVALADALTRVDVAHEMATVPGVIHGFLRNAPRLPAARRSLEAGGAFLAAHLKRR